nr:hypothetical protein [Tanacetum cinerariifolium]
MARLQFCDYHNMVSILEKSDHNVNFHPIVDFVEASLLRYALTFKPTVYVSHIRQFWSTARIETTEEGTKILAIVDGILRTVTESYLKRNLKLKDEDGISSLPDAELSENLTLMGYNISPNQKFTFQKGRIVPLFDTMLVPQGEGSGTPTEPHHTPSPKAQQPSPTTYSSPILPPIRTGANIAKTSTLPYESTSRVTSLAADEGSMQHKLDELTAFCTSLQRQQSEMVSRFEAQELEINSLKSRIKVLEDKDRGVAEHSGDDAPIKGRRLDVGEEAAERVSDDTKEMATVLTSMDAATVLASGVAKVPTGSGSIPTAGPPAAEVPTGSDVVPTAEFETPKKKKIQEQMDIHIARQLEEEMERDAQRMNEKIARDAEVARIHAEEELQMMINSLDRSNETTQQRKPWSKKQKRDYYMAIIKSNLGWKVKDFRGMTFKEIDAKFTTVCKQIENFIHMGSKEEAERPASSDKEMELWVELKRLYEPDVEDQLWTHTQNMMHAPVEWKLYDSCGVHHVTSKDNEIFMLIEKDYPLRKGLAIVMISYKLQPHDPDYVPEPMYHEYIPLEDEHVLSAEEQPLPPIDSPTAESPGYVAESDPEEDLEEYEDDEIEDGVVDYPIDEGDDADGELSGDDIDCEDKDEEDEKEEDEEHLAPANSAVVIPTAAISLPPEAEVQRLLAIPTLQPSPLTSLSPPSAGEYLARCTAPSACPSPPPVPSPLLPLSGCPTQIQTLRMASTQAIIDAVTTALPLPPLPPPLYIPPLIDRRDDVLKTEIPPRKRLCLSTLGFRYEIKESSTTRQPKDKGYTMILLAPLMLKRDDERLERLGMVLRLKKDQENDKIRTKQEAWRSQEMLNAVTVDRARKNDENKKRMNENANTSQKLLRFKEEKKREGPNLQFLQSTKSRDLFCQLGKLVTPGTSLANYICDLRGCL